MIPVADLSDEALREACAQAGASACATWRALDPEARASWDFVVSEYKVISPEGIVRSRSGFALFLRLSLGASSVAAKVELNFTAQLDLGRVFERLAAKERQARFPSTLRG